MLIRKKVHLEKQGGTPLCRMCDEKEKSIFHILSECQKLAQTEYRTEEKEREKIEKYQELAREIRRLWRTSATVIPVVVGASGAVANLEEHMGMLDIQKKEVDRVQFSALLGSARILRKVLDISG